MVFMRNMIFLVFLIIGLFSSSAFPDLHSETIILSTPRSGVNLFSCSLLAILRKPIGRYPNTIHQEGTARLSLDLISNTPFAYRTHNPRDVSSANRNFEKLILITRNPKELLFNRFEIKDITDVTHNQNIERYLREYFQRFEVFLNWPENKRMLILYEDMIGSLENYLIDACKFIGEEKLFWDDFIMNKDFYLSQMREDYISQHHDGRGASSLGEPKPIFHTIKQDKDLLKQLDEHLREMDPKIWQLFLSRFAEQT